MRSTFALDFARGYGKPSRRLDREWITSDGLTLQTTVGILGVYGCGRRSNRSRSNWVESEHALSSSLADEGKRRIPLFMRTFVASAKRADSRWHVIDAQGQVLGRVATVTARLLQGKHRPIYTPYIDTGDHVIIINAGAVKLTGRKEIQKVYRRHSGFEGGLREERAVDVRKRRPVRLVEEAVRGMLPKTKMGDAMYRKLKVYAGADHPHAAQQPKKLEVT
jgi:large subunit ribosomal protein L13